MILISKEELPKDHLYYRSSSNLYKKYLEKGGLQIAELGEKSFGWIKNLGLFQIAKFERIDQEPSVEILKKNGFKHGLIIWIPYSLTQIPKGWRKLYLNSHFTTTGFSEIDNEFYYKKWKERGQRARKKFLNNKELTIKLIENDIFQKIYLESKISQPFKKAFINYHKSITKIDEKNDVKNMVCFLGDVPIAGLSVIDYNGNSSAHLVSFLTNSGKKLQAGTGLIDFWFKNSLQNGIKYINFDHLRDKYMSFDQQGYTDFKENFMDYKVVFKESYFKIY